VAPTESPTPKKVLSLALILGVALSPDPESKPRPIVRFLATDVCLESDAISTSLHVLN
jgi:hypothetical protein